ncbi:cytochrome c biogenesis protein DipZ [uncultured Tolumonas sp.]|uniref:cytochrome c biogenesis protein DipZ n=1 Tax=uncultured Tolumonas sp. TaxID=263765 RepID=UPI002A0A7601|nr:cytochrome c biogenesis protein DipZ [uncultured Tolumonas sp.]
MSIFTPHNALALAEGFGLAFSPCILPILPFILAASSTGGRARPFLIISGFISSFTMFALLSRKIFTLLAIQQDTLQHGAFLLLLLLGLIMLIPVLEGRFAFFTNGLANNAEALSSGKRADSVLGGFLVGTLIGVVWTPCAGPLLAAALLQVVQAKTDADAIATVLFFSVGTAIPMLIISVFGQRLTTQIRQFAKYTTLFRRGMGLLVVVFALFGLFDFNVGVWAVSSPAISSVEADKSADLVQPATVASSAQPIAETKQSAPEITGITQWFNSSPLTVTQLKGKVVLVDFWTYSCINCIRTLPYIERWYEQYKEQGLVVIGVHSPEFPFESQPANVAKAIKQFGISYPVALDNQFATWMNYHNSYWPAHYLIDRNGQIVESHFGEGNYLETENKIRSLLGMQPAPIQNSEARMTSNGQTQETYLGLERAERFVSKESRLSLQSYSFPEKLELHDWALQGKWLSQENFIVPKTAQAQLKLHFKAGKVFLVMGSQDGKPVAINVHLEHGVNLSSEVHNNTLLVNEHRLYEVAALKDVEDDIVTISVDKELVEMYSFTFGN